MVCALWMSLAFTGECWDSTLKHAMTDSFKTHNSQLSHFYDTI